MNAQSHNAARALLLALLIGLTGCSILKPQKDESRFFILTPVSAASPGTVSGGLSPGASVGLGPVTFPEYLKRPELVTRLSSNQLELSEVNRWAEPLDTNFEQVLGRDLAQDLGTHRIMQFPWYANTHVDYQVEVQVYRFDTTSDGRSELDARWVVNDGRTGSQLFATETIVSSSAVVHGAPAQSAALSSDVGKLSREIAERIMLLNRQRAIAANPAGGEKHGITTSSPEILRSIRPGLQPSVMATRRSCSIQRDSIFARAHVALTESSSVCTNHPCQWLLGFKRVFSPLV